jgi:organic radical activating enzyme
MDSFSAEKMSACFSIFTSDQCNITCAHCCMDSHPKREKPRNIGLKLDVIRQIDTRQYPTLVLTGGEPYLLGDALFDLIAASRVKTPHVRLVTNASWARNNDAARAFLKSCKTAGLSELNLSTSTHHQRFVPVRRLATAFFAAKEIGFSSVLISASADDVSGYGEELILEINRERPTCSRWYCQPSDIHISRAQRVGRGASAAGIDARPRVDGKNAYMLRCPSAVDQPALSAKGELVTCAGMDLANSELDGSINAMFAVS